jgi:hypothetical protein
LDEAEELWLMGEAGDVREVEGEGEEWSEIPRIIELDGWQHEPNEAT